VDLREKTLYHQIHPAKLATDWVTAFIAAYLLWRHDLIPALLIGFVPSIIATVLVVRFADLERLKASSFGAYVGRYMTRAMEVVRSAGAIVFWLGAWFRKPEIMVAGILVILAAWARGKLWPGR
jgi:hypothetical protein